MTDALASEDGLVAVLDAGLSFASVSVRGARGEVARFEAFGLGRIGELLELAASSFEIDRWFVNGDDPELYGVTLNGVDGVISLEPYHPALDPWGPGVEISIPVGWPARLDLHPWRELLSWMRGVLRWRSA